MAIDEKASLPIGRRDINAPDGKLAYEPPWRCHDRDGSMKRLPKSFGCPVELSLELLGGKWKPVILARLKDGPLRYRDLRQQIPSLSDKVLTERLGELCEQGLVLRRYGGHDRLTA